MKEISENKPNTNQNLKAHLEPKVSTGRLNEVYKNVTRNGLTGVDFAY